MIKIDWSRKMLDIGRYRYRILKIDLTPWVDQICPICEKSFTSEPRFYFMSSAIHWDTCAEGEKYEAWLDQFYEDDEFSPGFDDGSDSIDPVVAAEFAYAEAWKEEEEFLLS